jgi:hypothetical protein
LRLSRQASAKAASIGSAGASDRPARERLDVRRDTVRQWCSGQLRLRPDHFREAAGSPGEAAGRVDPGRGGTCEPGWTVTATTLARSSAREAARKDLKGKRQQVSSFMLRLGRHYPGKKTWGPAHMNWLGASFRTAIIDSLPRSLLRPSQLFRFRREQQWDSFRNYNNGTRSEIGGSMTTCCSCSREQVPEGRTPGRAAQSGCRAWNLSSARAFRTI